VARGHRSGWARLLSALGAVATLGLKASAILTTVFDLLVGSLRRHFGVSWVWAAALSLLIVAFGTGALVLLVRAARQYVGDVPVAESAAAAPPTNRIR